MKNWDSDSVAGLVFAVAILLLVVGVVTAGHLGSVREDDLRRQCTAAGRTWIGGQCYSGCKP